MNSRLCTLSDAIRERLDGLLSAKPSRSANVFGTLEREAELCPLDAAIPRDAIMSGKSSLSKAP